MYPILDVVHDRSTMRLRGYTMRVTPLLTHLVPILPLIMELTHHPQLHLLTTLTSSRFGPRGLVA
jgi:hypothetical protein